MIHRVGPLLILDNGPQGWSRGGEAGHPQPLPPPGLDPPSPPKLSDDHEGFEAEPQLMLAALDASLRSSLLSASPEREPSSLDLGGLSPDVAWSDLAPPGLGHVP